MKRSITIELDDHDEIILSNAQIERNIERALKTFLDTYGFEIKHLECTEGSLKEAWGIEEYKSQAPALTTALEQSIASITSLPNETVYAMNASEIADVVRKAGNIKQVTPTVLEIGEEK